MIWGLDYILQILILNNCQKSNVKLPQQLIIS